MRFEKVHPEVMLTAILVEFRYANEISVELAQVCVHAN
jgi:hypothetical protein